MKNETHSVLNVDLVDRGLDGRKHDCNRERGFIRHNWAESKNMCSVPLQTRAKRPDSHEAPMGHLLRFKWNYVTEDEQTDWRIVLRTLAALTGHPKYFHTGVYSTDRPSLCEAVEESWRNNSFFGSYMQYPGQILIYISNTSRAEGRKLKSACKSSKRFIGFKEITSDRDAWVIRNNLLLMYQLIGSSRANIISSLAGFGVDPSEQQAATSEALLFKAGFETVGYDFDMNEIACTFVARKDTEPYFVHKSFLDEEMQLTYQHGGPTYLTQDERAKKYLPPVKYRSGKRVRDTKRQPADTDHSVAANT